MPNDDLKERIKMQQQVEFIESNAKKFLDKNALERYGNLKAVQPERALQVAILIAQASQAGQIKDVLSDEEFKNLLRNLDEPKREFRFVRK